MIRNKIKKFELDYSRYFLRKVKKIRDKYPEITSESRRTGKTLKDICFFIWHYAKEEDDKTIELLLRSSILVFAQDDFYDNLKISNQYKEDLYKSCKKIIRGGKFKVNNQSKQFIELITLWKEIIKEVKQAPFYIYRYWQEKSDKMNEAMLMENYLFKKGNVSFNKYIEVSIHSIGIMFIWANYFTKKNISNLTLKEMDKVLFIGAKLTRLSNDVVGYRNKENKMNAINIIKDKKLPLKYTLSLIDREKRQFNKSLLKIKTKDCIKKTIRKSIDFSIMIYTK